METNRRHGAALSLADALDTQLDRARGGIADLAAARAGQRAPGGAEPLPLDRFVSHVAGAWQPIMHRAGRRLQVDWRAGEVTVRADRRRLAQVLGNLISNALEHGQGSIRVQGRREPEGVRLEVSDDGPGVSVRGRPGRDGRGRGLAIARRAVEEAGGSLSVAPSETGGGVVVELPCDRR